MDRCDILGRQKTLVVSATISGFSTALGAFSPNFWVYFAARALTGFGSGGQVYGPVISVYFQSQLRNKTNCCQRTQCAQLDQEHVPITVVTTSHFQIVDNCFF